MGPKQSIPTTNGRTRAYSGSDLPSATASSNGSNRSVAGSSGSGPVSVSGAGVTSALAGGRYHYVSPAAAAGGGGGSSRGSGSAAVAGASNRNQSLNIPNSGGTYSSQEESESSTPEESTGERPGGHGGPRLLIGSLPAHLSPHLFGGFKCPVCLKFVSTDEMDLHLVICLTKPRVTYNGKELILLSALIVILYIAGAARWLPRQWSFFSFFVFLVCCKMYVLVYL
ncbi:E3 ubiquitin-protein ligase znrf2-like [Leucoraja erinacea]|uniref:E3 ubiquitin-protein ligase znrf2-like n=1 Tax=Leucoraja erinaceus TaxID=7782 RepID=UPI002455F105|nr:E3 ubiquitin-protein ligase znrf2-like [Leucoraja erinacea]